MNLHTETPQQFAGVYGALLDVVAPADPQQVLVDAPVSGPAVQHLDALPGLLQPVQAYAYLPSGHPYTACQKGMPSAPTSSS